jgi:hypothetical protein
LPERLEVGKTLNLENCTSLTSLPEGLEVRKSLNLENCTSLTSLPEGLKVGWFLNLQNCTSLTSLPKGLKVEKHLYIKNTPLEKLSNYEIFKMIETGYIKMEIHRKWIHIEKNNVFS